MRHNKNVNVRCSDCKGGLPGSNDRSRGSRLGLSAVLDRDGCGGGRRYYALLGQRDEEGTALPRR
jgi:hypothetical protein